MNNEKIQALKEEYEKRLIGLRETMESNEFKEHYKNYSYETYIKQYSFVRGKTWEINKVISDLEELLK